MKAADWNTLYRIGLGISILLFLFGMIMLLWGYSLVGVRGFLELGLSGLFVGGIFFLLAYLSYQKSEKTEKLGCETDSKHQK